MDTWPKDIGVGKTPKQQVMNLLDLNEFADLKNNDPKNVLTNIV